MLVLSRKEGQSIEFPELKIVVRVIGLKKSRVQLGIDAPRSISVHRSEKQPDGKSKPEAASPPVLKMETEDDRGKTRVDSDDVLDSTEVNRILDELVRLEAEFSAVAELADSKDRLMAQRVATDAIQRIEGINRSLRVAARRRSELQPIAELVKVRAEVLERLRQRKDPQLLTSDANAYPDKQDRQPTCAKEATVGYTVETAPPETVCRVA